MSTFTWGWKDYPRVADPSMTRPRMARLMRAWRRGRIQGTLQNRVTLIDRAADERVYRVVNVYGDTATFSIRD